MKHGDGAMTSDHEALGVITEEFHELVDAIRDNKKDPYHVREELIDVAIAALWGVISFDTRREVVALLN